MDIISLIVVPLVLAAIGGLGFLTYQHPKQSRKITVPLFYLAIISMFIIGTYYSSISLTYIESMRVVGNVDLINQNQIEGKLDSLINTSSVIDSNLVNGFNLKYKWFIAKEINKAQSSLIKQANKKLNKLEEKNSENFTNAFSITLLASGVFGVLSILSLFFEFNLRRD